MRELFSALQQVLEGDLLLPQHAEYEVARRVRNARIDCRPTAIVRCVSVQDIQQSLQLAEIQQLPVALRGGGAHVAGYGTCQDGLVLDLSRMKQIAIDPDKRLAHVAPGTTWGELDAATQAYGLAVPGPRNPTIGIAGHTLGGGEIGRAHV